MKELWDIEHIGEYFSQKLNIWFFVINSVHVNLFQKFIYKYHVCVEIRGKHRYDYK